MATFLNGVTDYVTQTHPTQSNLAFDQQMLQTKESAYVAGHKKINDLYGSILNSDMSRAENVAARDEFFKVINHDIKKMGGLDFSLDTNVQAAANVFQSIYTNKNIVKDMVWTKNYNNEIGKAESFKNCIDPEKCGGQFWQEGVDALNYRMEEFKGLNSTEAMSYGDVTYVPYNKVFDKALTYFKASGLKMSTDKLSEDGRYMVTTTNGTQLINPLTALFTKALADDPKFTEMYATKAFVERKGWMRGKINNGEYKDENDAMVGYMNSQHKVYTDKIDRAASTLKIDKDILDSKVITYEKQINEGKIKEGSQKYNEYREILALQQSSKEANDYLEYVNKVSANRNNNMSIISAGNLLDQQAGASFMMDEIQDSAKILAYSDYSTKKEVDAYKLNEIEFSQKLTIENKRIAADKEIQKMKNDAAEATAKAPKDKSDELNEQREAIALMENGADTKKIGFISNAIIANGAGPIDDVEIGKMLADYKAGKSTNENVKSGIAAYESTLKKEKMKYNGLLKEQQDPYIYPDVVSPSELAGNTYYDQEQTKTFLKKRLENANIKHEDKDVDAFAEYVRAQPDYANIPYATHASNYYKKLTKK
jgi:hypothetical protein